MIKHKVIITGLSGAGKTQALKILEDAGFYCVDNLPPQFVGNFISHLSSGTQSSSDNIKSISPSMVAIGLDIRGLLFSCAMSCKSFFAKKKPFANNRELISRNIGEISSDLLKNFQTYIPRDKFTSIIFLEADKQTLLARYRITRRKHPIPGDLEKSIDIEKKILLRIRKLATIVIDTSNLSLQELKSAILKDVGLKNKNSPEPAHISVKVISFGYKFGLPSECDIIFDVRFLKNPNYVTRLKYLIGTHPRIERYIFGGVDGASAREFLRLLRNFFKFLLPRYISEGKNYLSIGIGCTGGHHRSVAVAVKVGKILKDMGYQTDVIHRDADKPLIFV